MLKKGWCHSQGADDDLFLKCPDHKSHITQRHNAQLPPRIPFLKHFQHAHKNIILELNILGSEESTKNSDSFMDRTQALYFGYIIS